MPLFQRLLSWTRSHPARAGTLAGWYVQACTSFTALITVPLVLRSLSPSDAGLWFTFQSIIVLTAMTDFGFSLSFSRQIAWSLTSEKPQAEDVSTHDFVPVRPGWLGVSDVYRISIRVFQWVGLGAFIVMILVFHFILPLGHLLDTATHETTLAWYLLSAATFFTLLARAHQCLLEGTGRIYLSNLLFGSYQLACGIGIVTALGVGGRLVAMALTILISASLFFGGVLLLTRRCYQGVLPESHSVPPQLTRRLLQVALPFGALNFSSFLVSSIQVPLLGSLLGASSVSGFYIAQKIAQLLNRLVSHLALPQMPLFTSDLGAARISEARARMQRTTLIVTAVAAATFTLFFLLSPELVRIWIGQDRYVSWITLGLLSLDAVIMSSTGAIGQFVLASGRNPFVVSTFLTGLLNVAIIWLLVPRVGIAGVAAGSLIAGLCINYWYVPWQGLRTFYQLRDGGGYTYEDEACVRS